MKETAIKNMLKELAVGMGWRPSDPSRRDDWIRLAKLTNEIVEGGYSLDAIKDGIEHAKEIHPQYMPTNPMILQCIKARHHKEKENNKEPNKKLQDCNLQAWLQDQARCKQWNKENHDKIVAGILQPKMPNPDLAYGSVNTEKD